MNIPDDPLTWIIDIKSKYPGPFDFTSQSDGTIIIFSTLGEEPTVASFDANVSIRDVYNLVRRLNNDS